MSDKAQYQRNRISDIKTFSFIHVHVYVYVHVHDPFHTHVHVRVYVDVHVPDTGQVFYGADKGSMHAV